ncbi:MAG: YggT family protein [Candidatus Limnocylindria bacterium]
MTRDPVDPVEPAHPAHPQDETRVVERDTYVERQAPVAPDPNAVPPAGSQVNVNSSAYAEPAGPGPLALVRRIITLLFGILAVLIGLRILLLLLVANESNAIVDFVYNVTEPFVAPFRGVFSIDQVSPGGGSVFDVAALVALIGWLLIYLLLMAVLRLGDRDRVSVT